MTEPARGETAKSVSLLIGQALKGRTPEEDRQLDLSNIRSSVNGLFSWAKTLHAGLFDKPGFH
jgi:hypothetical protein